MATFKPVKSIAVQIWGKPVGAIALEPTNNFYAFEYDRKWIKRRIELAPLRMPLSQADGPFMFPELPELTYRRLPAMLADALPDAFGNALIDAWMADRGMDPKQVTTLDRLAYMGKRGMGALTFEPQRGPKTKQAAAVEMGKLVDSARLAVHGDLGTDAMAAAALKQIIQVGTSAGGMRAKATIAWNPDTQEVRTGQFDIPDGFEAWLLKFDGVGLDSQLGPSKNYGRIEYAYSQMALEAGLTMAKCRLLLEGGRAHFMTRRFDRDGNERHHMQSLCAMAHLDYKQVATHSYNQLLQVVGQLELGEEARIEVLRRMVFNVLSRNCDDHTKNFSFLLREGGRWELAPAYDITHAYEPGNQWISQHLMSVNGKFMNITQADVREVATRFDLLASLNTVIEGVKEAVSRWPQHAKTAGVASDEIEHIRMHIEDAGKAFG